MVELKEPSPYLFGLTTCAYCQALLCQDEALVKTVHVGRGTLTEHFCGENCHQSWYLARLRSWGM